MAFDVSRQTFRSTAYPLYKANRSASPLEFKGQIDLIREVLARHGYHVIDTRHGGEALIACEQHQGVIHMVLTDVVLAQMSARELAKRLLGLRPEMKILYVSGYTEEAIINQGVLDPGTAFLQKPFTPGVLARKVREVLTGEVIDA